MDIMLPPRRIVDFFVVVVPVPSSQNAIVSDMEMKPGHLSVRAYLFSWLRDMDFLDGEI